ncbi:MAG: redox-sensing transcriptional repressor Rex [Acidobacteriota bacterium]
MDGKSGEHTVIKDPREHRSDIPGLTARRLSIYLRCLQVLESAGVEMISSREIADQFHLNSAQFRKDLAYFGEFGVRGLGYRVIDLKHHLVEILGLNREIRLVILGAGNLGMALAGYAGFNEHGFQVVSLFDTDPGKIGDASPGGARVRDLGDLHSFVQAHPVDIAVLAVPAAAGQEVLDRVASAGIQAVLNFVPARLKVPQGVRLQSVDLKVQVESLVFHLAQQERRDPFLVDSPSMR